MALAMASNHSSLSVAELWGTKDNTVNYKHATIKSLEMTNLTVDLADRMKERSTLSMFSSF